MGYLIRVRQVFALVLLSAALSAAAMTGLGHFSGAGTGNVSVIAEAMTAGITDPSVATDERNNVEIYRAAAPGVVFITSSSAGGRGSFDY